MPCNGVAVARVALTGEVSDNDVLMALNEMGQTNVRIQIPGVIKFGNYMTVVRTDSWLTCANSYPEWMDVLTQKAQSFAKQARKRKAIAAVKKLGEVVNEEQVRVGLKTGVQLTIRF